jgi:hypothetical protein
MPHFISFPKISQFNSLIQSLKMDGSITFHGTVKLHGTNSAICVQNDTIWTQSRENVITPAKDNCGFSTYFSSAERQVAVFDIVNKLRSTYNISKDKVVALFGEWVGPGVQKGVAISKLPSKSFFLFAIRVVNTEKVITESNQEGIFKEDLWLPINGISNHSIHFYNVEDYKTFSLTIDLNDPKSQVAYIQSLVDEVEKQCPIAKAFNVEGIGEGIVWTADCNGNRLIFKTKGKEHAVTVHKDGGTVQVDTEKLNSLNEFATYAITEARLNQGIEKVFGVEALVKEKTGNFIKWITNDILTEEAATISSNGLSAKDVQGIISKKAREWLHNKIDMPH